MPPTLHPALRLTLVDDHRMVCSGVHAALEPDLEVLAEAGDVDSAVDDEPDRLTAREREAMRLIARGYACREAGRQLFISVKTVETHVSSVPRKLQLSSRHELTRWAADRRLL